MKKLSFKTQILIIEAGPSIQCQDPYFTLFHPR